MTPCRVLYVAKTASGGSAFSLYELVKGLDQGRYLPVVLFHTQEQPYIGHKLAEAGVRVITLQQSRQASTPAPSRLANGRDIARSLDIRFGRGMSQTYVALKACYVFLRREAAEVWPIVRAIRRNHIDLVHLNTGLRYEKPGIIAARLMGVPCVCHVRMFDQLNHFDQLFMPLVDTFVYISRAVADAYVGQGAPSDKGVVIHNAVDLSEFAPAIDVNQVRGEFGWTSQERVVGVVGRLDWWKGHDYFLEALARVAPLEPQVRGLIIGEPEMTQRNREYYQKLKALTQSLGLEDRVIFTGFRDDVARLMSALDVVVLSSSVPEPFGRTVIEGMAAGKPVVATAAGGVPDIIDDGINGLLVPLRDSTAMANAILALLSDRELARRVAEAGLQRVCERFTVSQHVAAVTGVYDALLESLKIKDNTR